MLGYEFYPINCICWWIIDCKNMHGMNIAKIAIQYYSETTKTKELS